MLRLPKERLLLLFLLVSSSCADTVRRQSADVQSETDPKDNTQLRGLSWFGADGQGGDDKNSSSVEEGTPGAPGPMIQLMESTPCEPDHEKARAVVSLFGKIDSGNEACAAEADPDSCSGGCCRFGTHFLCDRNNAFPELPCVCNRNTAANHPHQGHLHTTGPVVSSTVEEEEKAQDTVPESTVTTERDGENIKLPSSSGESQGNTIKNAATEDESDGLLASVAEFFGGNSEQLDAPDNGIIKSNIPISALNEAVFLTGWGGEPPEDQVDAGAIKHGTFSSSKATSPGNHEPNRALIEDDYDYGHGPVNHAQWLTPFAEGTTH
jgi:hypothetical protein